MRPFPIVLWRGSNERERVVPDEFGWAVQLEMDCVICKGSNGAKFIRDAENHSGRIRAVRGKRGFIGHDGEFRIHSPARHSFFYYFVSIDVAFDPQISPPMAQPGASIQDEGRITKMLELCSIRISLGDQLVIDVKLQVLAIGAENRLGKANRFVTARPVEGGLEHHFFGGIALRFVESCRRFRFPEDVRHSVITDAVPGTEIGMRVVVEGAPPNTAGVLRVRR
jgi:hypothetical protein